MKHHDKSKRRLKARRDDFEQSKGAKGSSVNLDGYRRPGSLNAHKSFSTKRAKR